MAEVKSLPTTTKLHDQIHRVKPPGNWFRQSWFRHEIRGSHRQSRAQTLLPVLRLFVSLSVGPLYTNGFSLAVPLKQAPEEVYELTTAHKCCPAGLSMAPSELRTPVYNCAAFSSSGAHQDVCTKDIYIRSVMILRSAERMLKISREDA